MQNIRPSSGPRPAPSGPSPAGRFNCPPPPARRVEQVSFQGPMPQDPVVGIVGGGISGLACALELGRLGVRSVVFDTGEHGVGGRAATRSSSDGSLRNPAPRDVSAGLLFDHAAQYITATDVSFQEELRRWEAAGAVREWSGEVACLDARTRVAKPLEDGTGPDGQPLKRYVAPKGFRQLAQHIASECASTGGKGKPLFEIRRPCWVNVMRADANGWRLMAKGRDQGVFDAVVIAHNGKCANRLVGGVGVPGVERQLKRLLLSSIWVVMAAIKRKPGGGGAKAQGIFLEGDDVLSWAANNTAKLGMAAQHGDVECWTLMSTPEYGRNNKVPQEAVPPEVAERVISELVGRAESLLGTGGMSDVVYARGQLWGAALPLNTPGVPCVYDAEGRVGIAGDWLTGASIQSAFESGKALARDIAACRGLKYQDGQSRGLEAPFKPFAATPIGEFPGSKAPTAVIVPPPRGQNRGGGRDRPGPPRDASRPQGQGQNRGPRTGAGPSGPRPGTVGQGVSGGARAPKVKPSQPRDRAQDAAAAAKPSAKI